MEFMNIPEALLWQLPNVVMWKDLNSVYLGCNQNCAKLIGYNSLDSIPGITHDDLRCEIASLGHIFKQQDEEAMRSKPQTILDIHRYADGKIWKFITYKVPLRDRNGRIVGVIVQMIEINVPLITNAANMLMKEISKQPIQSILISDEHKKYKLSKRESECLFYLLRSRTAKEIGKILSISPRTVEAYTEKLKFKFNCQTKAELIYKAIDEGFFMVMPTSILSSGLSRSIPL